VRGTGWRPKPFRPLGRPEGTSGETCEEQTRAYNFIVNEAAMGEGKSTRSWGAIDPGEEARTQMSHENPYVQPPELACRMTVEWDLRVTASTLVSTNVSLSFRY